MRPLPDLPHRDDEPDQTASLAVWALVFVALGIGILANRSPEMKGWVIAVAAVSFAAATVLLALMLVRIDRR